MCASRASDGNLCCSSFRADCCDDGTLSKGRAAFRGQFSQCDRHCRPARRIFSGGIAITLKLLYCPDSGRVLGAQATGKDGVDKRIDVIATAMAFKATVRDLTGLDLAYAPPYGSAKDPVHQAAFTACNQMDGLGEVIDDVDSDLSQYQIVDVRTAAEIAKAPLTGCSGVVEIPVDELRERLHELDSAKPTVS